MEGERYSLFSSDTLEDLRAATAAAEHRGGTELQACRLAAQAVADSDAGRDAEAKRLLSAVVELTADVRLVYLAYQFNFRSEDHQTSERLIQRRLELAKPGTADEARAWQNYGLLHLVRNNLEASEPLLRRALEIDTRIGNDEGIARDLGTLAQIPEARGDLDEAERLARESLAAAERAGSSRIAGTQLFNLGEIAEKRGRREEARALFIRSEAAFRAARIEKSRVMAEKKIAEFDGSAR